MTLGSLILFIFQWTLTVSDDVADWCYNPPGNDCSWYKECLVKRFPCEDANDSYAIEFGDTICREFSKHQVEFSDIGKRWIDETRACLQRQLVPVLSQEQMTCQEIKDYAFQTHTYCYNTPPHGYPTICDLPITDWFQISWIVKQSVFRETWQSVKQIFHVLRHCAFIGIFGE